MKGLHKYTLNCIIISVERFWIDVEKEVVGGVKIAFEKKLPDATAFVQMMNGTANAAEQYSMFQQQGKSVVAAYDGDKLVGVGGKRAEEWAFVIHPGYVSRDIEHNMKKLACW